MRFHPVRVATTLCLALVAPGFGGLALVHCGSSPAGEQSSGPPGASSSEDGKAPVDAGPEAAPRIPCDAANPCGMSLACCSSFCVDTERDPRNCGACGVACGANQFCTGRACDDAVFTNVCSNGSATVVTDPYPVDTEAGVELATALASCSDAGFHVAVVPQSQPGVLVPMGDAGARPNVGGSDTLVAGGSWWGQQSVAYMDNSGLTPVYLTNDGTTSHIYERASGAALVTTPDTALTAQHDFFFLELVVEPTSGTLCFFGEGHPLAGDRGRRLLWGQRARSRPFRVPGFVLRLRVDRHERQHGARPGRHVRVRGAEPLTGPLNQRLYCCVDGSGAGRACAAPERLAHARRR